jgi:hypothetical protein
MGFLVSRRSLLLLPAVLAATAVPVAPALAGEEDDGPATLRASQGCVSGDRAKATVTGDDIDTVAFYVDGTLRRRVTEPAATGRYVFGMRCARLTVGAHSARAVVTFEDDTRQTVRFQITRARQGAAQFTG